MRHTLNRRASCLSSSTPPDQIIRPFEAISLEVGDGHWLYVEQCGRPDGVPALFLHGGPGSGSQHRHRALFDPSRFNAILFDQRGSGRSHPYLSTIANTTAHLIADIERIRKQLGIDKWFVVGGSWGSTLALAYAQTHPERVTGMVLRAIFLGTTDEVHWAFVDGPKIFRPELYDAFVNFLPAAERDNPLAAYLARLTSEDPTVMMPAAHIWNAYERALSELNPHGAQLPDPAALPTRLPPTPIIEAHYIRHDFFLEPDQLLRNAGRLNGIPGHIVQGRYDLLCPPRTAAAVAAAWPGCTIEYIETAGHAGTEAGVESALIAAINRLSG